MVFIPKAKKIPYYIKSHGNIRIDNYYWFKNFNKKKKEIINYINKENNYTNNFFKKNNFLYKKLLKEMNDKIPKKNCSVPYIKNGFFYKSCFFKKYQYSIHYRSSQKNKKFKILINENKRAINKKYYNLNKIKISPNNKFLVICEDFNSRQLNEIHFKNLFKNKWLIEVIKNTSTDIQWSNNSKIIYYIKKKKTTLLPYKVYAHFIGTDVKKDKLIYKEKNPSFYISLSKTTSKKYIMILINSINESEVILLNSNNTKIKPKIFIKRKKNHEYFLDHYKSFFYILSNKKNENFDIFYNKNNNKKKFKKLFKNKKNIIENFIFCRNWIFLQIRNNGLKKLIQINLINKKIRKINFNDKIYSFYFHKCLNTKKKFIRFSYTSLNLPLITYELNIINGKKKILKIEKYLNFNFKDYKVKRIWINSRDKNKIPISLIYKKKLFKKKKNPLIIYGYGAYGINIETNFNINLFNLIDRGFIYAIAHVRGGGELGKKWYKNGKLFNKLNTFYDFIDVTKGLLKKKYGNPLKVFAKGESAGGLLMGSIINLKPKLFKGVIANVPFVDVINTMQDKLIPLTIGEYEEWGNPKKNKNFYKYIMKYSPYDQSCKKKYPNLFITTGLYDSQVQYWEPIKWVAKMREMKKNNNLILLKINLNSGHNGESGFFEKLKSISMEHTFLLSLI